MKTKQIFSLHFLLKEIKTKYLYVSTMKHYKQFFFSKTTVVKITRCY